ncbi:MAG: glycosyltransferase, partial [Parvibaculum sp.]
MAGLLNGSQLWSAALLCVLVFGLALVSSATLDRTKTVHRSFLFFVSGALTCRYLFWRATETLAPAALSLECMFSWSFFALEAAAGLSSLSAFLILSRTRSRSIEADQNLGWWGKSLPKVAILIATYNEERGVLERTIIGARSSGHANCEVLVLDDGRRDWLQDFCQTQGVRYVRRPDNKGSKAGNINHALSLLERQATPPDFVAVLDADFVPHVDFIQRALALFRAADVGLVQTPQHFFNPDPIQHNL